MVSVDVTRDDLSPRAERRSNPKIWKLVYADGWTRLHSPTSHRGLSSDLERQMPSTTIATVACNTLDQNRWGITCVSFTSGSGAAVRRSWVNGVRSALMTRVRKYGEDDDDSRSTDFSSSERKAVDAYQKGEMTRSVVFPSFKPRMPLTGYPPS